MRILLAATCLVAALGLACGGGESDSNEEKIETVLRAYFQHYIDSEIEEIYPLLDAASRRDCSQDQFLEVMSSTRGAVGDLEIEFLEISEIVIEADQATVTSQLRFDEVTDSTENTLIKEGSDWRIQIRPEICQT